MKKAFAGLALALVCALSLSATALAQNGDPGITATRVFGKITDINGPAGEITVKTEAGSVVVAKISEKTSYERMPPGETDRTKAVKIMLSDIAVGDGVYARGYVSEDKKSVPAQQVIVVSQSDIAKKQDKERAEWRTRGISGVIASLNPQTKEVTLTTRGPAGQVPVILPITDKVKMRRYAPDSIKFADAKKSTWEELKVGDQVRAKGEKSTDGARFTPEEMVTGAFRTVGGPVTAVDVAAGEVKINEIQSKQPLTIVLRKDSTLKRIPPEFMQMMMAGGPGGAAGPGGPGGAAPQGAQQRPAAGGPAGGPPAGGQQGAAGPGGGPQQGGGFDIQRIIDTLPPATLTELKPGEMVLVLSTAGSDPTKATAITFVAGVEPLFNMIQMMQARQAGGGTPRPPNLGTINLGIGGP